MILPPLYSDDRRESLAFSIFVDLVIATMFPDGVPMVVSSASQDVESPPVTNHSCYLLVNHHSASGIAMALASSVSPD